MMPYSKLEEKFISKLWLNSLEFKIHLALHVSSLLLPIYDQVFNSGGVSFEIKLGLWDLFIIAFQ